MLPRYHSFYILSRERYPGYLLASNCGLSTKYMLFATHPWKIVWDYEDARSHWCNAKIFSLCFLWSTLLYFLIVILLQFLCIYLEKNFFSNILLLSTCRVCITVTTIYVEDLDVLYIMAEKKFQFNEEECLKF